MLYSTVGGETEQGQDNLGSLLLITSKAKCTLWQYRTNKETLVEVAPPVQLGQLEGAHTPTLEWRRLCGM